jgi:LacI family transcriptional regulator
VKEELPKPAGIKDIAEALGVSIGTVDRALHARPGVNPETRAKVLKVAEQLNYRPNVAARNLKLNRNVRLAVHLPEQIASFYDPVREGIRTAARDALGMRVEVDFRNYERFGQEDFDLLERDVEKGYDGFILAPGSPRKMDPLLRRIEHRGGHSLFVATDAPHSPRLAFVGSDAYVCGAIAAELLAMQLRQTGSVAVMTGDLTIEDHAQKLRGFAATIAVMAPHLHLLPAVESHDDPQQAYEKTLELLAHKPLPGGIYVCTANSLAVIQAIEELGLTGKIQVVATDLFPELVPLIESSMVFATLHQRPFTQGKMAFEALSRYLIHGSRPRLVTKLPPHIVLKSNLRLFSGQEATSSTPNVSPQWAERSG